MVVSFEFATGQRVFDGLIVPGDNGEVARVQGRRVSVRWPDTGVLGVPIESVCLCPDVDEGAP